MTTTHLPPPSTSGFIVRRSFFKTVFWSLFLLLGLIALVFGLLHQVLHFAGDDFGEWTDLVQSIPTIGVIATAPLGFLGIILLYLFQEKLVIASDRIQVIVWSGWKSVEVMAQIPYSNIALIKYDLDGPLRLLGIDLKTLDDPETYLPKHDCLSMKKKHRWHYVIDNFYQSGLDTIHARIRAQIFERVGSENIDSIAPITTASIVFKFIGTILVGIMLFLFSCLGLAVAAGIFSWLFSPQK